MMADSTADSTSDLARIGVWVWAFRSATLCKQIISNIRFDTILRYVNMPCPNCITCLMYRHNINQNVVGFGLAENGGKNGNVTVTFHVFTLIFCFP